LWVCTAPSPSSTTTGIKSGRTFSR
jgi:hypothetical protein